VTIDTPVAPVPERGSGLMLLGLGVAGAGLVRGVLKPGPMN
jgi:hypothetical protein